MQTQPQTHTCGACNKVFSSKYSLAKHHKRQPTCTRWLDLTPGIKDYVDYKYNLPMSATDEGNLSCFICGTKFANLGNRNRHMEQNVMCSKWAKYKDIESLHSYAQGTSLAKSPFTEGDICGQPVSESNNDVHVVPKHRLCHIIWNVFLVDKAFLVAATTADELRGILDENDVKYIVAIFPDADTYVGAVGVDVEHAIMTYDGHDVGLDFAAFDVQCAKIEEYRYRRENVFVACNSGFQRSIPFLCYYLMKTHPDEVPSIEQAIDLVLPQVDRENYAATRQAQIDGVRQLLMPAGLHVDREGVEE